MNRKSKVKNASDKLIEVLKKTGINKDDAVAALKLARRRVQQDASS